jgi:hypothetical protein
MQVIALHKTDHHEFELFDSCEPEVCSECDHPRSHPVHTLPADVVFEIDDDLEPYVEAARESSPRDFDWEGFRDSHGWNEIALAPFVQTRDSDALDVSNYRVILADLREVSKDSVDDTRWGHWGFGWMEAILFDPTSGPVAEAVMKWESSLQGYPVADESDFSELESEQFEEYVSGELRGVPEAIVERVLDLLHERGVYRADELDQGVIEMLLAEEVPHPFTIGGEYEAGDECDICSCQPFAGSHVLHEEGVNESESERYLLACRVEVGYRIKYTARYLSKRDRKTLLAMILAEHERYVRMLYGFRSASHFMQRIPHRFRCDVPWSRRYGSCDLCGEKPNYSGHRK